MLQDFLNLIFLALINHNWRIIGLHAILLIGPEECHVVNIMDTSKGLPVMPTSEVQVIGSLPYLLSDGKWSNKSVLQFLRALQSQVPSGQ